MSSQQSREAAFQAAAYASNSTASTQQRLVWPDLARAGTIIAVVMLHVWSNHYLELNWNDLGQESIRKAWSALNLAFAPFRLPLFFAISGILASSALRRHWRLVAIRRIATPYYLYLVWLAINAAVYLILNDDKDYLLVRNVGDFLSRLWLPTSTLWYLYALALYFVAARILMRFPIAIVLAATSLLSAAATAGLLQPDGMYSSILRHFIFYLLGAYFPIWLKGVATHANMQMGAGALCVLAVACFVSAIDAYSIFGAQVAVGTAAIWAGAVASGLLARWRRLPRAATYIGQNTLPILVMHGPLIALFSWLSKGFGKGVWREILAVDFVLAIYPGILCMLIVALSLGTHRLLLLTNSYWLFRFPQLGRDRVGPPENVNAQHLRGPRGGQPTPDASDRQGSS